jgi:hypothetical protein
MGIVMISRRLSSIAIMLSLAALSPYQANADDGKTPFKLKAQVSDRQQLSRTELDPAALGALSPQKAPKMALATPPSTPRALPADNNEPVDKSYLQEYAVDWSGWIAKLADRWYYVLKLHEESVGATFVTQRPALIQFTCYSNGMIGNLMLRQTSGDSDYDQLQMVALMQTAPLPPFPQGTFRSSITLVQGWESHVKQAGEQDFIPGSFGKGFPMEKVRQWVQPK